MKNPEDVIPQGSYCYKILSIETNKDGKTVIKRENCPYWDLDQDAPSQLNGYCHLLKQHDNEAEHISLLFDMCKECGINDDDEDFTDPPDETSDN